MAAAQFPAKTPAQELPPKNAPNPTHLLRNPKRGEEGGRVACPLPIGGCGCNASKRGWGAGYKRGVHTRFTLSSSSCVDFSFSSSWLDGGSLFCLRLELSLLLGPVAVDDEGGRARCRDDQPAVPRLRRRDGAPVFFLDPARTSGPTTRAGVRHEPSDHAGGTRGAVARRDDALKGSRDFFFFSLGFV